MVEVRVVDSRLSAEEYFSVLNATQVAISQAQTVLSPEIQVSVVSELSNDDGSAIVILPVDSELDQLISESGLPGFSPTRYTASHQLALADGFCSGLSISSIANDRNTIELTYVLVPQDIIPHQEKLDLCLLEEVTQSFGIFGDPEGAASLFDKGNIDLSGTRPALSSKTLAMLKFLYSGHSLDRLGMDEFISSSCS